MAGEAPPRWLAGVVLAVGVGLASTAAILVRLGLPDDLTGDDRAWRTIGIAAGRLGVAAIILHVMILLRPSWRAMWGHVRRPDIGWAGVAGLFLAAHFATWFASLAFTTVAISVTLVTSVPIFVALAGWLILGERIPFRAAIGIGIAILGSLGIAFNQTILAWINGEEATLALARAGDDVALGNLLALLGAVTAAGYLLIGRYVRQRLPLVPYVGLTYAAAAIPLVLIAAILGVLPALLEGEGPVVILALAIGPQLIGHTSFNWAVRWVTATVVSVAVLAEPIGSTLLAWVILDEVPGPVEGVAALVLLGGIALVSTSMGPRKRKPATDGAT